MDAKRRQYYGTFTFSSNSIGAWEAANGCQAQAVRTVGNEPRLQH